MILRRLCLSFIFLVFVFLCTCSAKQNADTGYVLNNVTKLADSTARDLRLMHVAEQRKHAFTTVAIIGIALLIVLVILIISYRRITVLNNRLQAALETRDKLFSVIGHDLRGPANNLVQGLELIDMQLLPEPEETLMRHQLLKQARSMKEMLTELLTWARTHLKGIRKKSQSFFVETAIAKVAGFLEQQIGQKKLSLEINIPADFSIQTDRDQFDFIIRNLLSNAIKFSNIGGRIEITAEQTENEMVFKVQDEGVGLSEAQQKQFVTQRIESSAGTAGEKGTGLGLLLIKDFVRASGGRIWVQSEPGKGAAFSFIMGNKI